MGKVGVAILGAIVGGFSAAVAIIFWFGWGMPGAGQAVHADPTRADYVNLLLTVVTIFLGAVGLVVTVGALVIGLVALKTLREIKEEAADGAKKAAATKINETMADQLEPNVNATVRNVLPTALQAALIEGELAEKILFAMAKRGELDAVFERVVVGIQIGRTENEQETEDQYIADEGERP